MAESITGSGVKISAATLKQYHTEYRRSLNEEAEKTSSTVSSILPLKQPEEIEDKTGAETNQPDKKQSAVDKLFASK